MRFSSDACWFGDKHRTPPRTTGRDRRPDNAAVLRWADRVAAAVLPLTLVAVALALVAPSRALAERSDLLLAALVAVTALSIDPRRVAARARRPGAVLALSIGPPVALVPAALALGTLFPPDVADGLLALGLAPTEVASVGLVALAGGDVVLALAAVTGSLAVSAIAGPVLLGALGAGASVDTGELLSSFALVVLVPLVAGLAARGAAPGLARGEPLFAAASSVVVAALVFAALSGAGGADDLGAAVLAGGAFLVVSTAVVAVVRLRAREPAVAFCVVLRDFAVAATLAGQAFGPRAAVVAGVYGVMMLVAGAAAASAARRGR